MDVYETYMTGLQEEVLAFEQREIFMRSGPDAEQAEENISSS